MTKLRWLVLSMASAACGREVLVSEPYGLAECFPVDETCPVRPPHPSGPCAEGLACRYPVARDGGEWSFTCEEGQWRLGTQGTAATWTEPPPLAELCFDPLERSSWDSEVEIGPAEIGEAFRPFAPGETVELAMGPSGVPSLAFRVRVSRDIAPPECVVLKRDVRPAGTPAREPGATRVKLHCGESLPVFMPLYPEERCPDHAITLWAAVQALGETEVDLTLPASHSLDNSLTDTPPCPGSGI